MNDQLIATLKELPSVLKTLPRVESHPFTQIQGGIPRAALIELSGPAGGGKTELALRFLAENPTLKVAWVEQDFSIYPRAFPEYGVALERVLFVDAGPATKNNERTLWAVHQILRSRIFDVVALGAPVEDERALRRLQLAAEKARASVMLVVDTATARSTWPIALQAEVSRPPGGGAPAAKILRMKGRASCV